MVSKQQSLLRACRLSFLKWAFGLGRVALWSRKVRKSGKTKKNDISQVKIRVFEKSQEKKFLKKHQI